jgi:hypothetical protein
MKSGNEVLSTRGASGLGELDVAYIKDRLATAMLISDAGLPDYCLTSISQGALTYLAPAFSGLASADSTIGLIYRGFPGTVLSATDHHERMSIWIPTQSLHQRLAALLGEPAPYDLAFDPLINWDTGPGQGIRRLLLGGFLVGLFRHRGRQAGLTWVVRAWIFRLSSDTAQRCRRCVQQLESHWTERHLPPRSPIPAPPPSQPGWRWPSGALPWGIGSVGPARQPVDLRSHMGALNARRTFLPCRVMSPPSAAITQPSPRFARCFGDR